MYPHWYTRKDYLIPSMSIYEVSYDKHTIKLNREVVARFEFSFMEGDVATVNDTVSHTGAFLSMGLMTNFLSLKEIFLISLQGKPIFGVSLQKKWCVVFHYTVVYRECNRC